MMTQTSNISFFDNNAARSRVAVLLAANNGVDWIADQIYSILNQRHVDLTLWISVDRHNDGTLELLNNHLY